MPELNLKLQAPDIPPFAIYRGALIQTLQNHAQSKRMVFIVAAGGWGKSTLLASYARTLTCPRLWYNVDPIDQDPTVFLSTLAQGLLKIIPQEKKGLLPPLTTLNPGGSNLLALYRHLFNSLLNHPSQRLVLFFDDYHLAGMSPRFNSAFFSLFERAPLNLQIIISSRELPPLLRSGFSDDAESITLTAKALKFTADEIKRFFKQNYAVDLYEQDLRQIERQTDGWPVGLRLTGQRMVADQGNDHAASMIAQRFDTDLVDRYFQEQFNAGLPDRIRQFLAKAAIFDSFNPKLCKMVLDWKGAGEPLERMADTGLFVIRLDPNRQQYRFHHLFRQFLLDRLAGSEPEEALFLLHNKAAAFYVKQQQWREAASHFILARSYHDASIILKQHIKDFISSGSAQSLLQLLEHFPSDVVENDAALLYAKGWALFLLGRWNDARRILHLAKHQSLIREERLFYGQIVQLLMFLNFSVDDFEANQQLANESPPFLSPDTREAVLIDTQYAISLMQLGQPDAARDVWQRIQAHQLVKEDIHLFMETVPLMSINYHYILGDFEAAMSILDKSINHFRTRDYMSRLGRNLFFKGSIAYEMGDFSMAGQLFDEARQESLKTGDRSLLVLVLSLSSVNLMALGDNAQASELLKAADKVFAESPEQTIWKEYMLYWAKAMMAYYANRPEHFFAHAKKAVQAVEKKQLWMDRYHVGCSFALPYIRLGRPDVALALIKKVISSTTMLKDSYFLARAHLLMAAGQNALGENDQALGHLRTAIDIGKARNYDFLFLKKEADVSRELLPMAIERHLHLDFTAFLLVRLNNDSGLPIVPLLGNDDPQLALEAIRIMADLGCRDTENRLARLTKSKDDQIKQQAEKSIARIQALPPLALHVTTLGRFSLTKGRSVVPNTVWRRKLARSIAKFLIVHADREFTGEQLMDTFLSDLTVDEGRQLLNQAISAVRRALEPGITSKRESAYIKLHNGTYRLSLPEGSTVDLFAFENLCKAAVDAQSRADHYSVLANYSKAIDLYKGNFLPEDLYQQWTVPFREQAKSMYLSGLYATADVYYQKLEFERCIHQIQLLLREAPWDEKAHLLMMKCHFALGDRPRLIKAFVTCSTVLKDELGIMPSDSVRKFYNQAIAN